MTEKTDTPKVYQAIGTAMAEIAKDGIGKGRKNQQQGYAFRGVDEVMNALAPVLIKSKLAILPKFSNRTATERPTRNGGVSTYVTITGEFSFVSTEDGSAHVVTTIGEAMDTADKATNKAMSAAFKYAAFQAFCIPLEGMGEDADAHTNEKLSSADDKPNNTKASRPSASTSAKLIGETEWGIICGLIQAAGRDTATICGHYKIQSLKQMTLAQYADAKKILEGEIQANSKKNTTDEFSDVQADF